ncbi:MAG: MBL fold metallo-hydrolase [Symbiobacterium sp.]|uniref:MBL fold metallo-hydrolase n=1 Tax=Symbiobacterium sp. TaxID=1971213 RepID=UPI0034638B3F
MRVERISEHVWALSTWVVVPIRVWVVATEDGVTLVDAGLSTMARGILEFIARLGAGPLRRILLTHGHSDHTGAIDGVRRKHSVPVFAHAAEIPYMTGQLPYPRRRAAAATVASGVVQPLAEEVPGVLARVGGLRPYLTPGHSPGHVVYYHERDRVLLAGDLFTSRRGRLGRPMAIFTADMAEAVRSAAIVKRLRPDRLEVSHGGPVFHPAVQMDAYLAAADQT